MISPPKSPHPVISRPTPEVFFPKHRPPTASKHRECPLSPRKPLFPALRPGPTACSGASLQKQTPSSPPQGHGLGKTSKKRGAECQFHKSQPNWLNSSPDSPEKSAVASAFAAKTYPYDPEVAMQWIETLPQGSDRTKALEMIYQGMQKGENYDHDRETVEAFASEYGLKQ